MQLSFKVVACALCCGVLAGCSHLGKASGPDPVPISEPDRRVLEEDAQAGAASRKFQAEADEGRRRQIRDQYVFSRLALIDQAFILYVRSLSGNRRHLDSATEAAQMTASVAATLVDSVQAKTNLAAFIALVTGAKANVDKNYFESKGTDAILSTMAARRKEVLARILQALGSDSRAYPLLAAKLDADQYYEAGTMEGAFLVIQEEASKRNNAAQARIDGQQLVRNIQANLGSTAQADKRQLTRSLQPDSVSLAAATKALEELGVARSEMPRTLEAALDVLQEAVRNARTPDQVAQLKKAFVDAGIPLR